jgi:hypothetical protein
MFAQAIKYLKEYRTSRAKSLRNQERMRWSTAPLATLKELMEDKFGSKDENSAWEALDATKKADHLKLQAVRLKIAFLAGCRHDLRNQFAIGDAHEPKTALDFDRHAVNETMAAQYRLDLLEKAITTKEAGAKNI